MPRTAGKNSEIKENRRNKITLAALKVFCEKGYEGTSVEDIVKKANCSHGLFYHYFKSKKEIFDRIIAIRKDNKKDALEENLKKTENYCDKLKLIIEDSYYELKNNEIFAYQYYFFISQRFTYRDNPLNHDCKNKPKRKPPVLFFEEFFLEGQKRGDFTEKYPAKECAMMFLSIIQGSTISYVIAPKEIRKKMAFPNPDYIVDLFKKEQK